MAPFPKSLKDYINVAALRAYTKTVEAEYDMLKALHDHLGLSMGGGKRGPTKTAGKALKRKPRGKVKKTVLAFLQKNQKGKAIEIAKLSGLKVTSVHQTLYGLKKSGHVTQAKKRGSPFVLAKK
jgi:hypothetical protein